MRFFYSFLISVLCFSQFSNAQKISVDSSVGLQSLVEDNLVDGCVDISNIQSVINGSSYGFESYGYFERAGSNFPFERGIMLSTGAANSGGNELITPPLSEGSSVWGTDPDLETALGTSNTQNATSIEFDIVSISGQFQFNYLFASEDYDGINPCQVSDGFAFLIKETGSAAPYENIAIIPGTTTPVNTSTVHPNLLPACAAENEEYFAGYNNGDTNYIGRTTVLTASTTITPYVSYHVKLVIADQTDGTFDSAVFIEGDSFKILDLGDDITSCESSALLNGDINNSFASYKWFKDNIEITGALMPTYTAIESGTYRVEVTVTLNGSNCIEEDEIVVVLNTEEAITPITDYELCDDSSGDEIEIFDLSTKSAELIANIPFTNYTFSYHYSETEARTNTNRILTPIPNSLSNPQNIFVRIEDTSSGCFAYTNFDLIVNPLPIITEPTDLEVCDTDNLSDGYAIIDLTQKDTEITQGNSALLVTYHYSQPDADTGANPIPTPYQNINTPNERVYARILNPETGCLNYTELNINITISPVVNRDTQFLNACDSDLDGSASFDLTQSIADILGGLTGVTVTFHESLNNAQTGSNPIADETNYQYTNAVAEPGYRILYVRIVDDSTGCPTIVPLEVHTNLLLTGTDTGFFAICDTNEDPDDIIQFNLNSVETYIANELPNPIVVSFFEEETDRDANINALDKTALFTAESPTTLFITIEDTDSGCSEFSDITLVINPVLLFEPSVPLPYCDSDDDGFVSIDLHSLDNIVLNDNPNFEATYFGELSHAENNTNQLPPFYTNTNSLETIYARIEHVATGCATINPFQIEILLAPAATTPSDFVICDDDDDAFSIINLEDKNGEIVVDPSILIFSYYTSLEDANNLTNPIETPTSYNAESQTVYVRVESSTSSSGCYNIVEQQIIVNTLPNPPEITNYEICEVDGDRTADFLLVEKDTEILNGQLGKEVYYFEDIALTMPIDKNSIYNNTTPSQTIYVSVQNITDANCFKTTSFTIQVAPEPVYNAPVQYLICDDISNDEIAVFDLDTKTEEITKDIPDALNISYHLTELEAENNTNALTDSNYTNAVNPQTIYVRIESDDSLCFVVETLSLNIISAPDISEVTGPLISCDEDYDGITSFNLEDAEFEIYDRIQSNLVINYYENLNDINDNGFDNTNEILDPTAFDSNTQTVYIKVTNTLTGCFSVIPQDLNVNPPPEILNIGTISICDNTTDTYDLSQVDLHLVDDTSTVTISYHETEEAAERNELPLESMYKYTNLNQTLFARVTDIANSCHIVTSFNLRVYVNPRASSTPADLIECDDDFDGLFEFDLTNANSIILGSQDPSTHVITYYNNVTDADEKINTISSLYTAENGETIYARLESSVTKCYDITQFNTYINPLPLIDIDKIIPICNDSPITVSANTGQSSDTYLWSTGETTSEIIIQPNAPGNYSVTVTRSYPIGNSCSNSADFIVAESDSAIIDIAPPTTNFTDPNSITVNIRSGGIGDYVYILDDGESQTSNVFTDVPYGEHLVTVRDLNGCMDETRSVFIFDIPKFFTPNNDLFNDTWHVVGANQLPGTVVYIYNRYGKLLKTLTHSSDGWDGTFNGYNMPSDDYWYLAQIIQNGNAFDLRGHFALKR
ncbi:T9SS type B sorting domain-containing protein [Algibacter sp. L4_22]|uniref:T9SS type B sorting domain-containing protein n=1 Tax=Algibacter sp. L4_22 TaxID=2942477 RepID=UPI00201B513C|nr:choice-of-anchor L domain-containing protein [Algibacter sp. L4_22]MCL5129629.1 T9SS type B sorting domain-containing protein [Algibacter sp. L4_22]